MNDRTVMEKPERSDKNFSIVVPHMTYMNIIKISGTMKSSFPGDRVSLGSVCRELLNVIDHRLFLKLYSIAQTKRMTVGALAKGLLEEYVVKNAK